MQTIPLFNLSLVLIPALLVVWILWRWSAEPGSALYALARMVIQLILIGFVLTYLFAAEHALMVAAILSVMLLVSAWIALRSVPERRTTLYFKALLATGAVNVLLLILITQAVLTSDPWFQPNQVIPLAGMIFAVGMNAISLFAERFYAELESKASTIKARNTAYRATLIPTLNSLLAVGLVSLPGMMTGQILSGVSPLIAVRYQIMIMLVLFSSSGLTAFAFYYLARPEFSEEQN
ncbi:iron export ABC transporter permease subunit FetB [Arenicella chitinivorans]|uniref:Iron export ABC transporter permease subunit FetB n=1 Tax=Arenicella chitinivorans TaxID=1329800 RepID=A0A918RSU6_9GAMM|nr:ABC transporter permease [Arenicella chitinivorans]GHA08041.1 iron export ABC transporter permease subunit FetB [Arenicella chitinivorans]